MKKITVTLIGAGQRGCPKKRLEELRACMQTRSEVSFTYLLSSEYAYSP